MICDPIVIQYVLNFIWILEPLFSNAYVSKSIDKTKCQVCSLNIIQSSLIHENILWWAVHFTHLKIYFPTEKLILKDLSLCLSFCLSVPLCVCLSVFLSVQPMPLCLFVLCVSVCLSVCLSVHLCLSVSIRLPVCALPPASKYIALVSHSDNWGYFRPVMVHSTTAFMLLNKSFTLQGHQLSYACVTPLLESKYTQWMNATLSKVALLYSNMYKDTFTSSEGDNAAKLKTTGDLDRLLPSCTGQYSSEQYSPDNIHPDNIHRTIFIRTIFIPIIFIQTIFIRTIFIEQYSSGQFMLKQILGLLFSK